MKLVNISSKIISIGDKVVMPDGDIPCNKTIAELPAIKALIKRDLLRIDSRAETEEKAAAEKAKAAEAKKKAEAEAKAAKANK